MLPRNLPLLEQLELGTEAVLCPQMESTGCETSVYECSRSEANAHLEVVALRLSSAFGALLNPCS